MRAVFQCERTRLMKVPYSRPSRCSAACEQGWGWSIEHLRDARCHRSYERMQVAYWSHHTDLSPALLS